MVCYLDDKLHVCQYNLNTARISELVQISEQPIKSYCVTHLRKLPIEELYYG